jgi:hypothetical protein
LHLIEKLSNFFIFKNQFYFYKNLKNKDQLE